MCAPNVRTPSVNKRRKRPAQNPVGEGGVIALVLPRIRWGVIFRLIGIITAPRELGQDARCPPTLLQKDVETPIWRDTMPGFPLTRRTSDPGKSDAANYVADSGEENSIGELRSLADCGDNPIRQFDGSYPALVAARELEFRKTVRRIEFEHPHREAFPVRYPEIVRLLDH